MLIILIINDDVFTDINIMNYIDWVPQMYNHLRLYYDNLEY